MNYIRYSKISTQRLLDIYSHGHAWDVMTFVFNPEEKAGYFDLNLGHGNTTIAHVSYEDLCSYFGWKSFTLDEFGITAFPVLKDWQEVFGTPEPTLAGQLTSLEFELEDA